MGEKFTSCNLCGNKVIVNDFLVWAKTNGFLNLQWLDGEIFTGWVIALDKMPCCKTCISNNSELPNWVVTMNLRGAFDRHFKNLVISKNEI